MSVFESIILRSTLIIAAATNVLTSAHAASEINRENRNSATLSKISVWPAPGSADTELGVLMEPEVDHGETEVYTRVQA